jgi:hypothetical protein
MGGAGVCVPRIMDSASRCVSVSFRIGIDRTRNDRRSIRTGRVIMSTVYDRPGPWYARLMMGIAYDCQASMSTMDAGGCYNYE